MLNANRFIELPLLVELNTGSGDALDLTFEPLGWEDTLASTGGGRRR